MTPNPDYLNTSNNLMSLRRYQRAIKHHDKTGYMHDAEYLLIETFFAMTPDKRVQLAVGFPWLNMQHTTWI